MKCMIFPEVWCRLVANPDTCSLVWWLFLSGGKLGISDECKMRLLIELTSLCPQSFFAERFFALFDSDGSSSISLEELLKALDLLIHGNETDKLRFLFQVYDVDGQPPHTHARTLMPVWMFGPVPLSCLALRQRLH